MESHRIAVISDTHGLLRPEVAEHIKSCETVLHSGDMDTPGLLCQLKELRPTYAVRGNGDGDWAEEVPRELELELYGFHIYMIHDRKQIKRDLSQLDLVVYGHSHKYEECREGKTKYLNPGSCGRRRFRLPVTMALLTLYPQSHEIAIERIELGKVTDVSLRERKNTSLPQDMHRLVKTVMKEMDAGKSMTAIALRHHADEALVERICRMYATHPGVDVDGILDRIT